MLSAPCSLLNLALLVLHVSEQKQLKLLLGRVRLDRGGVQLVLHYVKGAILASSVEPYPNIVRVHPCAHETHVSADEDATYEPTTLGQPRRDPRHPLAAHGRRRGEAAQAPASASASYLPVEREHTVFGHHNKQGLATDSSSGRRRGVFLFYFPFFCVGGADGQSVLVRQDLS